MKRNADMTMQRAILEIENMIHILEDRIGSGTITKIWVTAEDIDALRMAKDALLRQRDMEDDRK